MIMTRTTYILAAGSALALAVLTGAYVAGKRAGETQVMALWSEAAKGHAEATARLHADHRDAEQRWSEQLRATTDELHAQILATEQAAADTIDDLRNGTIQLQERFRACSAAARVPDAASPARSDDAPDAGGLSDADAQFLVRLSATADQVARQLTACQAYVRSITQE